VADTVKHAKVVVNLGQGNKYAVLGRVLRACKKDKLSAADTNAFIKEAEKAADTNELLRLICDTFTVA
jgi:hypothetical protein